MIQNLVQRLVGWALFGVKYKKVLLEIRPCDMVNDYKEHKPHQWVPRSSYVPYNRSFYCKGTP